MYYVYVLQSEINREIYVGSANDLKHRFQDHNNGKVFSTKRYIPWKLIYYEAYQTEKLARMREKRLKHNGNAMKELKKRIGFSSLGSAFKVLKSGAGFTLAELSVVLGIILTLVGLATISLINTQQRTSLNTTVEIIIADLRSQQVKAMVGDTQGLASANDYGVHFDNDKYVLFYSATYSTIEPSNFEVKLPENLEFSTIGDIVFSKTTGEISSPTTVVLKNITNNEEKTIQLNKLGVVTQVN